MAGKFFLHQVPEAVKSKIKPILQLIFERVEAKHKEQTKADVTTRQEELTRARSGLIKLAYGNTTKPEKWSASLKANIKLDDLVSFAEKQGIFDFDAQQLKVELADFKKAELALANTMAISGAVHENDNSDKQLKIRAATTLAEIGILELVRKPGGQHDMQVTIQRLVHNLRAEGGEEKTLFFKCMFVWAFSDIKGTK